MDSRQLIEQLYLNGRRIFALVDGVADEQARWKPDPGSWSVLEVVNHLYDEEREDFKVRLDYILHKPGEAWPPIDPQGWVTKRQYNQRDLATSLENYLTERRASMQWLMTLFEAEWETTVEAPWGKMKAGDMLAAWASHDLLHMRQLVALHWAYQVKQLEPYEVRYAGEW